ncbi:glycosyltransferase family 4 protein [Longirhabdus pacifica]|uniref:glycosyltransferase family 4 protein n=1 Tax=Longirhabdus pacifica TaxID=2305227 RepID=UPI0010089F16|nr:glycosyltransferase family 4 protein [Longirhabdus pacifica]
MARIMILPVDIAGQSGLMSKYLNANHMFSIAYNTFPNYLQCTDHMIETDLYSLQKVFHRTFDSFDIYHYMNSCTIFSDQSDLRVLHEKGKKVVMNHRGSDIRSSQWAVHGKDYHNPYVITKNCKSHEQIVQNLEYFSKYVSAAVVTDYECYKYVKDYYERVYVIPQLIETHKHTPIYPQKDKKRPVVLHAPTHREFKGTDYIIQAVQALRPQMDFEFRLIENMTQQEAFRNYQEADIIIDQIRCGAYGNLGIEAMTLGKAVIAYIREDLVPLYPLELPIVSANPDQIKEKLKMLLLHPELRHEIGKKGRAFVEKYHDAKVVMKSLISMYEEI